MATLVCVKDGAFLKIKQSGVAFEELAQLGDSADRDWYPYKLWLADLYACERCGVEVITGTGRQPVAEHFQIGYAPAVGRHKPMVRVDDAAGTFSEERAREFEERRRAHDDRTLPVL